MIKYEIYELYLGFLSKYYKFMYMLSKYIFRKKSINNFFKSYYFGKRYREILVVKIALNDEWLLNMERR